MTGNHVRGICMRCAKKTALNALRKEWTGLKVCSDCYDVRNAQDFVRGVADRQAVKDPSPEPADYFLSTNEVTSSSL
jgi:ribosome-binding protein aMBF1 (putative translation factor)